MRSKNCSASRATSPSSWPGDDVPRGQGPRWADRKSLSAGDDAFAYSPWYDIVGAFGSALLIRLVALTVVLLDHKNVVAPEIGRIRNRPLTASAHLTDGA